MDKEIIKKWIKKVGIAIGLVVVVLVGFCCCKQFPRKILTVSNPYIYVSPFDTYTGKCETFNFKAFSIELPEDVCITSSTFDGVKYKIRAEGQHYYDISVIPFEKESFEVNNYLKEVNTTTIEFTNPTFPFIEGNIKGMYSESSEETERRRKVFSYENFCFTKQGFTFYITSYGNAETYYSAFDFIKSIKILSHPITKEDMKKLANQMLILYQNEALILINRKLHEEEYGMKLLDDFKCTKVKGTIIKNTVFLKCTLIGDYSKLYPAQKSSLDYIILDVSRNILPYTDNFELLGYKIVVNYYKLSGEQISLERSMYY